MADTLRLGTAGRPWRVDRRKNPTTAGATGMNAFTRRDAVMMACGAMLAANAWSADSWVEGRNYFRVEPPQPPAKPGIVTVTEIFSYGCPGCNAFLPFMQAIEQRL